MRPGPIQLLALTLCFAFLPFQTRDQNQEGTWQAALYEKDVQYEKFACKSEDADVVAAYFKEHPLSSISSICHNDCPVVSCRPVIYYPQIARAAKVTGTVSVHVLVDEEGKTLYARVLNGHPLLLAAARKGACETRFTTHQRIKRQGVMHFAVDGSDYLWVPYTANEVR